jgi:hypothetical protein
VIIALNFCPFARREVEAGRVHFQVSNDVNIEDALHSVVDEFQRLDISPEIETTLLIFANGFNKFDDYLELLELANELLVAMHYEGIYQLASFHPDYCFAGERENHAGNYTNRSPYPMLHLIREGSLERVLENYPDPETIPERNIKVASEKGAEQMQSMLQRCLEGRKH